MSCFLNTANSINLTDGDVIENSILENNVVCETEIVEIPNMPRQGLSITFLGNDVDEKIERIFYWKDNGWEIVEKRVEK